MSINRTIAAAGAIAIAATGLVACNDTEETDGKMDGSMTPSSSAMMSESMAPSSSAMMSEEKMDDKMMEESK
ncbi:hypothetical protein M3G18_10185 [Corynebacterium sp. p3-SID1145]|uniref:hypothetical protein n=1 Tax=unclassified Corynebacterium TaxID=2624378 RepID=UPI0021A9F786|nr:MULTISPECIES: hypothetical protein [unclassified Corynebacterium]MCT1453267.1 hypothetical protein [Corynebacterium sp. p3-SID1145]MCT1462337.1 hypothetical protein [Corynebacterium sp. p3-SID1140]